MAARREAEVKVISTGNITNLGSNIRWVFTADFVVSKT
jgi:hypothetical protein